MYIDYRTQAELKAKYLEFIQMHFEIFDVSFTCMRNACV